MSTPSLWDQFPKSDKPVLVVFSGGLDSTVLLHACAKLYPKVAALSFYYSQRHGDIELKYATEVCKTLGIDHIMVKLDDLGAALGRVSSLIRSSQTEVPSIEDVLGEAQPSTYVPCRNGLFALYAASLAESYGAELFFMGIQCHDLYQYWDCSEDAVNRVNQYLSLNREHPLRLVTPFLRAAKWEEIRFGRELGVDFSKTWTCYNPGPATPDEVPLACGECPSCAERIMNFAKAGIEDPTKYAIPPFWPGLINSQCLPE